jgi:uncharacterized protein (TIGR03435 family)
VRYTAALIVAALAAHAPATEAALSQLAASARPVQEVTPRFEFITLRRNTTGSKSATSFRTALDRRVMLNMSLGSLILRAYSGEGRPPEMNVPAWFSDARYDVVMGGPFYLSRKEQQPLWRALIEDRFKLAAHIEKRTEPSFDLVLAQPARGLGPGFGPPRQECPSTPTEPDPRMLSPGRNGPPIFPTAEDAMARCGLFTIGGTFYSGGVTMAMFADWLPVGRRVVDLTGVRGSYSATIRNFQPPGNPNPEFTAALVSRLEAEFGLTLRPSTIEVEVIVIDHIEPPTETRSR